MICICFYSQELLFYKGDGSARIAPRATAIFSPRKEGGRHFLLKALDCANAHLGAVSSLLAEACCIDREAMLLIRGPPQEQADVEDVPSVGVNMDVPSVGVNMDVPSVGVNMDVEGPLPPPPRRRLYFMAVLALIPLAALTSLILLASRSALAEDDDDDNAIRKQLLLAAILTPPAIGIVGLVAVMAKCIATIVRSSREDFSVDDCDETDSSRNRAAEAVL
jgi:hypothetical protein